ncbi:MAG: hypothetical protein C0490_01530 [Marivirga sp.]|nr:hypothetical protein [Marivirga sp.]
MGRKLLRYLLIAITSTSLGQTVERTSFEFLNVPNNARLSALGGVNASLADRDVNFFFYNPALISDSLSGFASASYQHYVADIGQATFSYVHRFSRIGVLTMGVQHLSYGTIKGYDPSGFETGDFKSGATVIVVGKSHQISNFRLGANLKVAFSAIAGYRASALLMDLGGVFIHPQQNLTVGLSIKNLGIILSEYSESSSSHLPFDVEIGATFKPEHMPLRFSLTAFNLAKSDVTYYNPMDVEPEPGTLDKVLRRINFGAEVLIHRNVNVMIGYNYLVHQELKLADAGGAAGLSFGLSVMIKSFELVLSRSTYVVGNAGYAFTLSKNIDKMLKRR